MECDRDALESGALSVEAVVRVVGGRGWLGWMRLRAGDGGTSAQEQGARCDSVHHLR